jgi:uncharacterized protein (DUF2147 family)
MTLKPIFMLAAIICLPSMALADPIEGSWKRPNGNVVVFAKCGAKFCATAKTGPNAGKSVGTLAAAGGGYKGTLSDPAAGKTYTGKATVSGGTMKMSGCVLGGLLCRGENWTKQ